MRSILVLLLWVAGTIFIFAQGEDSATLPVDNTHNQETIPIDTPSNIVSNDSLPPELPDDTVPPQEEDPPHIFARYFQWGKEYAFRNGFYSLETLFLEWDTSSKGFGMEAFNFRYSLLPFSSVGLSVMWYSISQDEGGTFNMGIVLYTGFVLPVTPKIHFFGDLLLEIGRSDWGGLIAEMEWLTLNPGYDLGISVDFGSIGFEIKYRGTWHTENRYVNSLGIGYIWKLWND